MNATLTADVPTGPLRLDRDIDMLRFATAGSVDDGKSTLVGRLLHDSKSVLTDTLEAVERASRDRGADGVELALLTDGLRAERADLIKQARLIQQSAQMHERQRLSLAFDAAGCDSGLIYVHHLAVANPRRFNGVLPRRRGIIAAPARTFLEACLVWTKP